MTMRALLLVLLALPAMAQRPDRLTPARMDRRDRLYAADASAFRLLSPSYAIPGGECAGQAITGTRGEVVTFTRSSSATCTKADGTLVTLSSNQPRVSLVGGVPMLLVEGSATNSFLNSGSPATQTITHATGTFTLWMDGTGSIAAAVGTATASGLPCTASSGTACTFTVSVGGTVVYTVTGSPTRAQVENRERRTSYVATAGTAATRAAELASFNTPAALSRTEGCAAASIAPGWSGNNPTIRNLDIVKNGAANYFLFVDPLVTQKVNSYNGTNTPTVATTFAVGTVRRYRTAWSATNNATSVTDLTASTTGTPLAFTTWPAFSATSYVGADGDSEQATALWIGNVALGTSTGACDR